VATTGHLASLIREVLGEDAFALRATFFDKTALANWRVGWHQDQIIEVAARVDAPGYQGWSVKDGAAHVRPPAGVLAGMVAARIHLDDTFEDNGPLDVSAGSHRHGWIADGEEARHLERGVITVTAERGDVLVMKPLILHRSRAAGRPVRRRVLHVEYAAADLPGGVDWGARYAVLAAARSV
jgi:ectoine hydroxylase-related dioxygenase (phytanoyl-CoA dioxygenase family)